MNQQPKIAILLSTYNGRDFLSSQLDSILAQTYQNYILVIRDDCSSDDTRAILANYQDAHPEKFHLLPADVCNRGASASFSSLIEYVLEHKQELGLNVAYMMFCDQDDVWYENKIERELEAMLAAEAGNAPQPVLVHSDLEVVSESLTQIAPSFIRYQGLEIHRNQFCNIVISNLVTGCTAFINEALALKACPVSKHAIMHDWWLALVATAFGKLVFLDTPLVCYRQHGRNTIGAKEFIQSRGGGSLPGLRTILCKPNTHLLDVASQAQAFAVRYRLALTRKSRICLTLASGMNTRVGFLQRFLCHVVRQIQ